MQEELKNPFIFQTGKKELVYRCYSAYINYVKGGGCDPCGYVIYLAIKYQIRIYKNWKSPRCYGKH